MSSTLCKKYKITDVTISDETYLLLFTGNGQQCKWLMDEPRDYNIVLYDH